MTTTDDTPRISVPMAALPIVLTFLVLGLQLFVFDTFVPHVPLILGIGITAALGRLNGCSWDAMQDGMLHVVRVGLPALGILLLVGMITGVWIAAGTVPTLIYYGLELLSPQAFLATAAILCAVVSVSLGTSWGTLGTVGLALMGIGHGFGLPAYWTAGAVVSGAFFGDKISPLSDTTNLAPAVTGVNLFTHIRNLMPTTVPSMAIALAVYTVAGFVLIGNQPVSFERITSITDGLAAHFTISAWTLLPVVLVIGLALARMPAMPTLFFGVLVGAVTALIAQGASLASIFDEAFAGYSIETGVESIDGLLNGGGIQSMTWVITLLLIALSYGGVLERTGCLRALIEALVQRVRSFGGLQTSAIGAAASTNVVAGDPYLSIALTGRMFGPAYRGQGAAMRNLSRATEEGGTLVSPLVPWNAGGAVVITALGLGIAEGQAINLLYIPLAFACWLSPLIGMAYGWLGWFSPRADAAERAQWQRDGEHVLDVDALTPASPSLAATSRR
ncbi:sodium:proton antiporter [Salinisphaera orenii MK-B5]|uniref:Sodium:proton antiporter n=1 Tax=Salinisphaera orenii MK-B5 TaxID=856730 RepID=A0A423PW75_9GAMM|nr:Na+/H+ antiporter NhaC [Salinisphaera orenii]ROO29868.1 sodium:proton antiporter [Salinisphaera orenii MK-B5]